MRPFPLPDEGVGTIEAPAGHGKTQTIVETIASGRGKPTLALTHTNVGVQALRERLDRLRVPRAAYDLATLDGWSQRIVAAFPATSEYDLRAVAEPDFPQIRAGAVRALASGALDKLVRARYGRILVDEYQDCDRAQHQLVILLGGLAPVTVFGDPLQAIFDFEGQQGPTWQEVLGAFPLRHRLETPWRWRRSGCSPILGDWIAYARDRLQAENRIDPDTAPADAVRWLAGTPGNGGRSPAADIARRARGSTLIIAHSAGAAIRHEFARHSPGVTVVERADLPDLGTFAKALVEGTDADRLKFTLELARDVMTGISVPTLSRRLAGPRKRRSSNPASPTEIAAAAYLASPSPSALSSLLSCLEKQAGTRIFRPELLRAVHEILLLAPHFEMLPAAADRVRDRRRHIPRKPTRIAVGSTLLLKGLEADHAIILDAAALRDPRHLYVAISRGAQSLTIIGENEWLRQAGA